MWKYLRSKRTLFSTLTILGLFYAVTLMPDIELFDPLQNAISDFEFTDIAFYSLRSDDLTVDTNIVLINLGNLNRPQLAEKIRLLSAFSPKVIGIDVLFRREREPELDTPLVNAIREAKTVVMVARASGKSDDDNPYNRDTLITSHPKFLQPSVSLAHDDLLLDDDNEKATTVRKVAPRLAIKDSVVVDAFALKLAEKMNPELAKKLLERGNEEERINYRGYSNRFFTLDHDQVVPENLELVRGKAVLIGFMGATLSDSNTIEDKKWSPMSKEVSKSLPDMFGVVIHANFLSTILNQNYINVMSDWMALVLAILTCFVNIALFYYVEEKSPDFFGGVIKLIQFLQAITVMIISITCMYYLDYVFSFGLMLAVILLSPDLYELYESSFRFLKTKMRNAPRLPMDQIRHHPLP